MLLLLFGLLVPAVLKRRWDPEQGALAIPLGAWSFICCVLLVVGRSGFSAEYGNASRYTTLTVLGVTNPLSRRLLQLAGLLSLLLIAVVVNYLLHDGSDAINPIAEAAKRTAAMPGAH